MNLLRRAGLALAGLANHLGERGRGLRAGELVTTGSCSGVVQARAGDARKQLAQLHADGPSHNGQQQRLHTRLGVSAGAADRAA